MRVKELYESRIAPLYHSTTLAGAINILRNGKIKPTVSMGDGSEYVNTKPNVSLTRDKSYWVGDVQFKISQVKLSQTHKIDPFSLEPDIGEEDEYFIPQYGYRTEAEERVYKPIPVGYIEHIVIDMNSLSEYPQDIKRFSRLAKKLNIPISGK